MKVKSVVEHRFNGETKDVGQIYELPDELVARAIAEGWVEAAEEPKD